MPGNTSISPLESEQKSFDEHLEELLKEHSREYALWKGGEAIGFFPTYDEAHLAGLEAFGLDSIFLVAHVAKEPPKTVSLSWSAGVMLG